MMNQLARFSYAIKFVKKYRFLKKHQKQTIIEYAEYQLADNISEGELKRKLEFLIEKLKGRK